MKTLWVVTDHNKTPIYLLKIYRKLIVQTSRTSWFPLSSCDQGLWCLWIEPVLSLGVLCISMVFSSLLHRELNRATNVSAFHPPSYLPLAQMTSLVFHFLFKDIPGSLHLIQLERGVNTSEPIKWAKEWDKQGTAMSQEPLGCSHAKSDTPFNKFWSDLFY